MKLRTKILIVVGIMAFFIIIPLFLPKVYTGTIWCTPPKTAYNISVVDKGTITSKDVDGGKCMVFLVRESNGSGTFSKIDLNKFAQLSEGDVLEEYSYQKDLSYIDNFCTVLEWAIVILLFASIGILLAIVLSCLSSRYY